jgi:hypothetical protein
MNQSQKPRCEACDGERVLWLMSEFPVPCPECNENSPEFKRRQRRAEAAE